MKNEDIQISVVTIVKDNKDLLPRAIESVLNQAFTDFEYILVDDGSKDGTADVIDSYAEKDGRIKPLHFSENQGRSNARNAGMDASSGKYLFFLDSDDYIPCDALQELYSVAEKHDADIVYGRTRAFDNVSGKWLGGHYTDHVINRECDGIRLADHLGLINNHQIVGRLYRFDMLKANDVAFNAERKNGEDVLFAFLTALHAERISMRPDLVSYFYGAGKYLERANQSKLFDARDNLIDTMHYAKRHGSEELQKAMLVKGVKFASALNRAEKVYEGDEVGFLAYISSLMPLVSGVTQEIHESLSSYDKAFYEAVCEKRYIDACMIWRDHARPKKAGTRSFRSRLKEKLLHIARAIKRRLVKMAERAYQWMLLKKSAGAALVAGSEARSRPGGINSGDGVKVSVIVPVYNVEEYLRQCLASIVAQTLEDIEIICVNDKSTDKSAVILEEYSRMNDRIRVLEHDVNRGLSAARNTGVASSTGEFVYFIDSDDYLAKENALERLYDAAKKDGADEVIGGIVKWHEQTGERYLDWHENYLNKEIHGETLATLPQLRCNVIAVNKLIKRSLLEENRISFIESVRKYEDNPFSCKVHVLTRRISIVPDTIYIYRQSRAGSITHRENKEDAYHRNEYCSEIFRFIESKNDYHQFRKMYYPMYLRQLVHGARVLAQFSPTKSERDDLMSLWSETLSVLPEGLSGMPTELQEIVNEVRSGNYDNAWDRAIEQNKG